MTSHLKGTHALFGAHLSCSNFWVFTDRTTNCWVYLGRKQDGPKLYCMHRKAWRAVNGPIPKGYWVLHNCDNGACIRPTHLYLGTPVDNTQDALDRQRTSSPVSRRGVSNINAKLTDGIVYDMRSAHAAGLSQRALAQKHALDRKTVHDILFGITWTHVPMVWQPEPQMLNRAGKLTPKLVRQLRKEHEQGLSAYALGKKFGVCKKTALQVIKRQLWASIT